MARETLFGGLELPDYISVTFDFENRVIIFLNK